MPTLFPEQLMVWRDPAGFYRKISELSLFDQLLIYGILAGGVVAVLFLLQFFGAVNWTTILQWLP